VPQPPRIDEPPLPLSRLLTQPGGLILLVANAVPIVGVLFWHWDAFLLLVLYWMETAVIGFWTLWLIGKLPDRTIGGYTEGKSTVHTIGFLTLHAGIFMTVHFVFLWALFAGDWKSQIHNVIQFVGVIVIGQGLWFPLLVLFFARGVTPMLTVYGPDWYGRPMLVSGEVPPVPNPWQRGGILYALYARIIVMQFAIIVSSFIVDVFPAGAVTPLILLIAIKTAVDLGLFLRVGFEMPAPAAAS
jgi:Family of unknown function (DUF6498)